ncbi:hypothetical protein OQH60_03645 [Campylobacter sp. MIT 21-1685]|nr:MULTISPECIES: hypothetical protein [unclassified Campylobacter]MCX2682955.1 hypothetical protein [Campylobacter sp. MIT 21-1684]MCX2751237.1 hypothetical protein [Campylobacter sp. MIT 21-1682]MCX2807436.1 hypothetical protein [Campylobacter sp. MIT 21-1685]
MKNLSLQEKKDLDSYVFQNLEKKQVCSFANFLHNVFCKIKTCLFCGQK